MLNSRFSSSHRRRWSCQSIVPSTAARRPRSLTGWGARGQLEEEDLLLHLGREKEQVHELGDAGAREAELAGHVGEVCELAALEPAAQGVREGELTGDACG